MPRTFGSLRAYEPGLMDKARWWMQDTLTPAFGGDAKAAGAYVNDKIMPTAEWLPGIGDAMAAGDAVDYFRQGSPMLGSLSALGAAVGLVPGVGDAAQKGIKGLVGGLEKSAKSKGVDLFLSPRGKNVAISKIVVPENMRNQGVGSSVMQEIIDTADANQLNLSLSPTADFGGNRTKLDKFYKRFGFEPNKGGTRDFEISETMRRYAKQPQTPVKTQGIRAYHGSPHSFDKFSMENIGTGEGAQAYGQGLYFAENEGIARSYRDTLSDDFTKVGGKRVHKTGRDGMRYGDFTADQKAVLNRLPRVQGGDSAEKVIRQEIKNLETNIGDFTKRGSGDDFGAELARGHAQRSKEEKDFLQSLLDQGVEYENTGSMYEVNINADPEQFLDWDKPFREQPKHIQEAIEAQLGRSKGSAAGTDELMAELEPDFADAAKLNPMDNISGAGAYRSLADELGAIDWPDGADATTRQQFRGNAAARATDTLREAGIPGIKYLDQGSRGAGDGSRNYVVFDDSMIEILKKYGLAGLGVGLGANAFGSLAPQQAQAQSRQPLDVTITGNYARNK